MASRHEEIREARKARSISAAARQDRLRRTPAEEGEMAARQDRRNAMTKNARRAANYKINRLKDAARAMEHAATALMGIPDAAGDIIGEANALRRRAGDLLAHGKTIARSDEQLESAWEGELELDR